ncbi:MAG: T9SS type A sorting domain-containing protein [Bacteroidales bacterium]|nr:T9SS type A sorting domain-containing protein [Bacteroidales bacterium]
MRLKRLKLCIVFLSGIGLTMNLQAQNAIPATGGNASGSSGSVSYTIGQVFYATHTSTNNSLAEGVQQPYEISVVVGIEQARDISLICTVYPNPATDLLTLELESPDNENMFFLLYDIMGKLLVSKKLIDIKTTISMANLAPSTYLLKVADNERIIKTFKIIKTR